jgi:hypothetical protein
MTDGYMPEWMPLLEAIEHVQRIVGSNPREACDRVRLLLRDGRVKSRCAGTEQHIKPVTWYRATVFEDGRVEFGDDPRYSLLRPPILGRPHVEIEVRRNEVMKWWPAAAERATEKPAPGPDPLPRATGAAAVIGNEQQQEQIRKGRRGPARGQVDRYRDTDHALYPELDRLTRDEPIKLSINAAALLLGEQGKIAGTGARESRAHRLADRYRKDRGDKG